MSSLWIQNARVIDPASKRDAVGDLFVVNGKLVSALSDADQKRAKIIDARGLVACPGLVDIHVHFREPGQTNKETIATGSRAAAAGGFTTIVCMPNTTPPADNAGTIQSIKDAVARDSVVKVFPTGCITSQLKGEALAPIGSLKRAGVVAITDDGNCVQANELMRRAAEYAKMFGLPIMDHCQDHSMTHGAAMNEGVVSTRLGLRGWPNAAEDVIVSRNVILATYTGAHIHMQHISSRNAVEILRRAKSRGVSVSAEATPHHIALTEDALVGYDTNLKMNPPLRTEADRTALVEALASGLVDCVATDHAPHASEAKEVPYEEAPFGCIGLETAFSVLHSGLVETGALDLATLVTRMSTAPARIAGLVPPALAAGAPADLCVFDPATTWRVAPETLQSRSSNSPWLGQELRGRVRLTVAAGRIAWDDLA